MSGQAQLVFGTGTVNPWLWVAYAAVFALTLGLVLYWIRTKLDRALGAIAVCVCFAVPLQWLHASAMYAEREANRPPSESKKRYLAAKSIFDKLCAEHSQPIIKRTVEDVEGVLLMKVRPSAQGRYHSLWADPSWAGAALPMERNADTGYAEFFLLDSDWTEERAKNAGEPRQRVSTVQMRGIWGFRYVDSPSADGTTRIRTTAVNDPKNRSQPVPGVSFKREMVGSPAPRYAVTYEDNVDPELRKHWIAGTTIQVIDRQTNEVIGQQSFWRWDDGFGNQAGGRQPWTAARHSCPRFIWIEPTHHFVSTVLKTKQGS
jgi:hypothetical protein